MSASGFPLNIIFGVRGVFLSDEAPKPFYSSLPILISATISSDLYTVCSSGDSRSLSQILSFRAGINLIKMLADFVLLTKFI